MRTGITLLFLLLLLYLQGHSQGTYSEFPGLNASIVLPDTSFHYDNVEREYSSKKFKSGISFTKKMSIAQEDFERLLDRMLKDTSGNGATVLVDTKIKADSNRLLKFRWDGLMENDPFPGNAKVIWVYFLKAKDEVYSLMVYYGREFDSLLHEKIMASVESLKMIN